MARIRSKSAHLIAVAVGAALVLMPLPPLVASAHLSAGRVARPKMSQPRLQRVGTANVRQLATQAAAGGGGLSSNLESEAGPWIDFEREGSAVPHGAGAPAPGNTAAVVNQNQLGWEGLTHADQRLAGGGNQFSLEPPDQGLCVGNVSPNDPSLGPEVVESVNDALVFYDAAGEQFTNPITISEFYGLPRRSTEPPGHSDRSSPTPSATSIRTRSVGSTRSWSSRRTPSRVRSRRRPSSTSRSAPPARRSAATSST